MNSLQGPPPEPGSEKRILLAFVLTFVVIVAMQPLISRYVKQPEPQKQEQKQQQPANPPVTAPSVPAGPTAVQAAPKAGKSAKAGKAAAAPVETKQASAESETVIENDLYRIVFTNKGAQVKSWVLQNYNDDKGKPLNLVHTAAAEKYGYPLSLWTWDEGLRNKLNSALYVAHDNGPPDARPCSSAGECGTKTLRAPAVVTFEYSDGDLKIRKTFAFDESYVVRVRAEVEQKGAGVSALVAWPAGFGDQTTPSGYASGQVNYQYVDNVERIAAKKISSGNTIKGPLQWAAATDQYFAAAFLPDDVDSAAVVTLENTVQIPKSADKPDGDKVDMPVVGIAAGSLRGATEGRFFAGPKALKVLDEVHAVPATANGKTASPDLEKLVDFGKWFGFLAKPLFLWLEWTHDRWVANWGWDIIILTVIITVAVMPLRVTSMKSALKMQRFQPQMKAIQEKYKSKSAGLKMGDPRRQEIMQQQNAELAALYKKEGINPAGGCVPMLLQMPFLIAFYSMLGVTIELRHAHFLWISDLSSPDPWHILPVLVFLSMIWVQGLTPQGGMDPVQQRMMQVMMPVMFGVMSWNLSSGLGLYWVVSQLLAIAQQYVINNTEFGREMRAAMAKRAKK